MKHMRHRFLAITSSFLLAAILGLALFGVYQGSHAHHGEQSGGESMMRCIFSIDHETLCQMNVVDHVTLWKQIFLVTITVTMVLAAAMAIFPTYTALIWRAVLFEDNKRMRYLLRFQRWKNIQLKLSDLYTRIFAQGILKNKQFTHIS
jgi:hypothetical protein